MAVFLVLLILAGLGFGFWWLRRPAATRPVQATASAVETAGMDAAGMPRKPGRMINPGAECCQAVKKIENAWYAEGQTPVLPLEQCEHPQQCKCGWMRVLDRRVTHRRIGRDRREGVRFEEKSDRRTGEDRRDRRANAWKNSG